MADSTYRRARATLLDSGELVLAISGGGRARTNHWTVPDPGSINSEPVAAARARPAPSPGSRPLLATARATQPASEDQLDLPVIPNETAAGEAAAGERTGPGLTEAAAFSNPGQNRTVPVPKDPGLSGVSTLNPGQNRTVSAVNGPGLSGVSAVNPGQDRTVCGETPPETPSETPPLNVRAGREPLNPRISKDPPSPPGGGSHQLVSIVEDYLTPRGRQRHRTVTVDLDQIRSQLPSLSPADRSDWQQIRADVTSVVGASMFEIWLAPLELVGCDDDGGLLLACPTATRQWVASRYAELLERIGRSHGRSARLATDRELQLVDALAAVGTETPGDDSLPQPHQEAV